MFTIDVLKQFAHNNCVISKNEKNDRLYNYAEIIKSVEHLCEEFQALDVPQSIGFAVKLKDGHTAGSISFLIAILNHGCHFCSLPEEEFSYILIACGARFLVSNDEMITRHENRCKMKAELQIFDETFFLFSVQNSFDETKLPKNMCFTIGTSGSTGKPKIVHVPYECIAPNISALCSRFKLTSNDVIFFGTPITFDPFVVELFMALSSGAALLITESKLRLAPQKLFELLWPTKSQLSVTILQMTPSLFRLFGDATRFILAESSALRILILGGEEFPKAAELKEWFPQRDIFNKRIFNVYGITEISCWSTIHEIKDTEIIRNKCIPIGEPIDNVLCIVEATEESANGNQRGELILGSAIRKTYIPETDDNMTLDRRSADTILFRRTGDLVERNEAGEIYYIGRLNNTIKRMGKRICLDALEQKILSLFPSTGDLQVICLFSSSTHRLVCCLKFHTASKNTNSFVIKKRIIMENLMSHEKPDEIMQIEAIPLNSHGKIDRKKLLEWTYQSRMSQPINIFRNFLTETLIFETEHPTSSSKSASKRQKLEDKLTKITESFTSMGGTSFHALSLATEIGKYFLRSNDQRRLLEMFLDSNISISDIVEFLQKVPINEFVHQNKQLDLKSLPIISSLRKLKFLWRVDLKKCVDSKPAVDFENRYICIGSHARLLITIDAFNGKEVSRLKLRSRIECEAVFVSLDLALIGCNSGFLYAFNFLTGNIRWSMYIGCKVKAKPLAIGVTHAIIGCYDANFNCVCVCLESQKIKWRKKIGTKPIFSSPLRLDNLTALICTLDGTYERLDIQSGNALWNRKRATPIFSTPSVLEINLTFAIAEVSGKVHICEIENGDILHSFSADGNVFSNMTIHHASDKIIHIIFGSHDHSVYCLNYTRNENEDKTKSNLYQSWKTKFTAPVYSTPVVAQLDLDHVITCTTDGMLSVLELHTGSVVVTNKLEGEIFSTPCCLKNEKNEFRIYFGCRDNYLYCFQLY